MTLTEEWIKACKIFHIKPVLCLIQISLTFACAFSPCVLKNTKRINLTISSFVRLRSLEFSAMFLIWFRIFSSTLDCSILSLFSIVHPLHVYTVTRLIEVPIL